MYHLCKDRQLATIVNKAAFQKMVQTIICVRKYCFKIVIEIKNAYWSKNHESIFLFILHSFSLVAFSLFLTQSKTFMISLTVLGKVTC